MTEWERFPCTWHLLLSWDVAMGERSNARHELLHWTWTYRVWNGWKPRCAHCNATQDIAHVWKHIGMDVVMCFDHVPCTERKEWPWLATWKRVVAAHIARLEAMAVRRRV